MDIVDAVDTQPWKQQGACRLFSQAGSAYLVLADISLGQNRLGRALRYGKYSIFCFCKSQYHLLYFFLFLFLLHVYLYCSVARFCFFFIHKFIVLWVVDKKHIKKHKILLAWLVVQLPTAVVSNHVTLNLPCHYAGHLIQEVDWK